MSISFCEATGVFTLQTDHSTYQMQIGKYGLLQHLYYGKKVENMEMGYLLETIPRSFSPTLGDHKEDKVLSVDWIPQEYPSFGIGDFRPPCLNVENGNGSSEADLRYACHEIFDGKRGLPGLPAVYGEKEDCQSLIVTLEDRVTGVRVKLSYSVFPQWDVITRSAEIINSIQEEIVLDRALSCCVDFLYGEYDLINFFGRHNFERNFQRQSLIHGKILIDSVRGASSHQQNPFVILCDKRADEISGDCYGFSFLYSGNFMAEGEINQFEQTRIVMGINDFAFRYQLKKGESFVAPEVAMCFSPNGFGQMSRNYHRLYREHLCRGVYKNRRRPILINNWEATYFQFDDQKLYEIARDASELGIEMLVMDDGWFGKRDDDNSGLGDWVVNENKIRGGLKNLAERINGLGMKFGIWFEPEMVSEDSELFRAHPDWCLHTPGRTPAPSRQQLVLDLSRKEVEDYLFDSISKILESAPIAYVKWDFNRHLTNVWSAILPREQQGQVYHRFVLGLYSLLERLLEKFPEILFEGCSGGGGRFDAGMLYYTPQIWCSDNTDAIDRLRIQYGTSFGYPVSSMGSHVSVCPNHATGRTTPLATRGIVAMSGTFGYELDITLMTPEEKEMVKEQVKFFQKNYDTITFGDYYRLTSPFDNDRFVAWEFVSQDGKRALLNVVFLMVRACYGNDYVRLQGLEPGAMYRIHGMEGSFSGTALMNAGLLLPRAKDDYMGYTWEIEKIQENNQ